MPPALVNALDTVYHEWTYKPVGFVSYGGVSGGMRAVQTARADGDGFKMMPMVEAVNIPFFTQLMQDGVFKSQRDPREGSGRRCSTSCSAGPRR